MTPRQSRFVDEYLCDLVATKAAIRAVTVPGERQRSAISCCRKLQFRKQSASA
nr:terminase small subunit [Candidatus Accumulibacter sp. ACC005]